MDKYDKLGCDMMNESGCEELLDEDRLNREEIFDEHFKDEE